MYSLSISSLHYYVPFGIGAAARFDLYILFTKNVFSVLNICINCPSFCSIRVSNELGAGHPQAARLSVYVVMVLVIAEAVIVTTVLYCCRYLLGYAFSNEWGVVNYVAELVPLLSISVTMDSLQAVLSGEIPIIQSQIVCFWHQLCFQISARCWIRLFFFLKLRSQSFLVLLRIMPCNTSFSNSCHQGWLEEVVGNI